MVNTTILHLESHCSTLVRGASARMRRQLRTPRREELHTSQKKGAASRPKQPRVQHWRRNLKQNEGHDRLPRVARNQKNHATSLQCVN